MINFNEDTYRDDKLNPVVKVCKDMIMYNKSKKL